MKEKIIFELYKDTPFLNARDFRREVQKYYLKNPINIYIKIVNYQIKKYGRSLQSQEIAMNYKIAKRRRENGI